MIGRMTQTAGRMRALQELPMALAILGIAVPLAGTGFAVWEWAVISGVVLAAVILAARLLRPAPATRVFAGLVALPMLFLLAFEGGWYFIPATAAKIVVDAREGRTGARRGRNEVDPAKANATGLVASTRVAGDQHLAVSHGGHERPYLLHVPTNSPADKVPLLVELHGRGIDPIAFDRWTGFRDLADREGFAVALPGSVGPIWNDGRFPELERSGVVATGTLNCFEISAETLSVIALEIAPTSALSSTARSCPLSR